MDVPSDDVATRQDRLERWVEEQQRGTYKRLGRNSRWTRLRRAVTRPKPVARGSQWFADRVLNRGFNTSPTREPEHEHPDRVSYVPSPWHTLPRALRHLEVSDRDTFIDFGCGKGGVVHQAAKRPFHRVIGVEISPALAEIARTNLAARRHQHRCPKVEILVSDVAEFSVPDDLTIGYLFDPFRNETLGVLLQSIIDSIDRRPRRVLLIYVGPYQTFRILETGRFRLLKVQRTRLLDTHSSHTEIFESC